MVYFHEEQRFNWVGGLMMIPAVGSGLALFRQVWQGHPIGDPPLANSLLWSIFVVSVVVAVWFSLTKLVVEVRDDVLSIDFRFLWPLRTIEWRQMRRAEAIAYRPVRDFGGWGVRWAPRGVVYNTGGNRGVRIYMVSGERVLVGSRRADELAQAITARIGAS